MHRYNYNKSLKSIDWRAGRVSKWNEERTTKALGKQSFNFVTSEREEINIHGSIFAMEIQIKFSKSSIFFCPRVSSRWEEDGRKKNSANNFNAFTSCRSIDMPEKWNCDVDTAQEVYHVSYYQRCINIKLK